ncbi:MAG TPA: hypothetical protein DCS63_11200 [Elusimicrobia bacterium]|nr:hypothetical protein [Elusimicrobiota bacterium]
MKKSNILIAAVAVMISAASSAKAVEPNMDFDGKFKPQTMHDIFTDSLQRTPIPTPAPAEAKFNLYGSACAMMCIGQLTDDCRCEPFQPGPDDWNSIYQYIQSGNNNYCMPVASGPAWLGCVVDAAPVKLIVAAEIPGRSFREMSVEQKRQLAMYYILQGDLKKAVIARSAEYNFTPEITAFVSDVKTKILYDNKKVYIANGRMLLVINDAKLIVAVKALRAAIPQYSDTNGLNKNYGGIGIIIGCAYNNDCWDDVGDAVSDATEWYVTHVQDHTGDPLLNTPD